MPTAPDDKLQALIDHCSFETARACFRRLCPSSFERTDTPLENANPERFGEIRQFGELKFDKRSVLFAYTEVADALTERSARKDQFEAARAILKNQPATDAGIFIFRGAGGTFRLSLISKIYKGSKAEFSHFRRYTYFVDPNTDGNGTFIRQVGGCAFDSLESIQEAFSVEAINKDFYRELSNWYFWAMKHVHFPTDDVGLDKKDLLSDKQKVREHDAKNLIRLLTRLLFVWFIKQRDLVPHELFDPEAIARDYLDGFDPESRQTRYYKAILQNFFFAALNQTKGERGFRRQGSDHRDNTSMMRYKNLLNEPERLVKTVESVTPFLNGGLFECLDFLHPTEFGPRGGKKKVYEDGFSDREDNPLVVPDFLFFGSESIQDLSDDYGDTKRKKERVQGLIHILNRYNFTIVENTPIEQEVALDPELLGKVFENLLASYNPETQTTARKQTGSFYTPRSIVDYMVDESLKAYLQEKVTQTFLSGADTKVEQTFLSAPDSVNQTFLSASSTSSDKQTGMSAPLTKSRRNLPHWKRDGAIYWITFRMADSLPQTKLNPWKAERDAWEEMHPQPWDDNTWREYNERFGERLEEWLDAGMGSCALARSDVRDAVKSCLLKFDGQRLIVHSAVIMPNHVHALIEPLPISHCDTGIPACESGDLQTGRFHDLSRLLQGIKGASAREANQILGTTGRTFWLDESYDHIVRSEAQYQHYLRYIAENPVKAKLRDNEFWLQPERSTDIPVCDDKPQQTGMSAPLSERIDLLFSYTEETPQFSDNEKDVLIRAIDQCKILDPACGSGAFPMGILQKLVHILAKLDPLNIKWEERQKAALTTITDIKERREREYEVARDFRDNDDDYGRKLYLIENCLYGLDIQSIATQVSKLRFFISLVVDQKIDRAKENFGVRPLPNLETKFVTADTLIAAEQPEAQAQLSELTEVQNLKDALQNVRHKIFSVQTTKAKQGHKETDARLREQIAAELKANGWPDDSADRLAKWDPYKQNESADFFDPEWMFGLKGFDVVIGNPPYIQIQKFPKEQKDKWAAQNYATYAATADIYCLFYERGADLLNAGGQLAYITSNKWMRAGYGEKLRGYLADKVDTHTVLDFGMAQNFGAATTYTCITQFAKDTPRQQLRTCYASDDRSAMRDPGAYFEANAVQQSDLSALPWVILTPERHAIKQQVEAQGIPLAEWDIEIYRGVLTGYNEAFYLTQAQRDAFVAQDPKCADYLVPLLRGRYVSRYKTDWDGTWMINSHNGVKSKGIPPVDLKKECPLLWEHLKQYEPQLAKRQDKGNHWSNLRNCVYFEEFAKPKIIYPNMTKFLPFYYDRDDSFFGNQKCFIVTSEETGLGYLTGFLNSSLFKYSFRENFPELMGNTYELSKIFIDILPVKKPTPPEAALFEKLVRLVQSAKKRSTDIPVCAPAAVCDPAAGDPLATTLNSTTKHTRKKNTDRNVCATLEALIDACVLECYFPDHMAERDLLFQDDVAQALTGYNPDAPEAEQLRFIETLHQRLTEAKIPERLRRIPEASPDLLGIILKEGKV